MWKSFIGGRIPTSPWKRVWRKPFLLQKLFPRKKQHPPPKFPPEALRSGDSGQVMVEFTVGPDGSVRDARVVGGDGRVFGRAALDAVRRWRFQPLGISVTTRRPISFNAGGG